MNNLIFEINFYFKIWYLNIHPIISIKAELYTYRIHTKYCYCCGILSTYQTIKLFTLSSRLDYSTHILVTFNVRLNYPTKHTIYDLVQFHKKKIQSKPISRLFPKDADFITGITEQWMQLRQITFKTRQRSIINYKKKRNCIQTYTEDWTSIIIFSFGA